MSRASASRSWDSAVGSMRSAGMGVSSAVAALPGRAVGAQPASGSRGYQRAYLGTVNGVDERLHTGSVTDGSALDPTLSATESGRGQRKWTRRQSELFDRLVDLFLIEGFADLTLEDIAGRLRCSKSTLYALAHSKEQLAVAVAAVAMAGIQRGDVTARTGLTDAEAYAELATLVLHGVSA